MNSKLKLFHKMIYRNHDGSRQAEADVAELWGRLFGEAAGPYYRAGTRQPPAAAAAAAGNSRAPRPGDWLRSQPLSVAFAERASTSVERESLLEELKVKQTSKVQPKEKKQKVNIKVELVTYDYDKKTGKNRRTAGKSKLLGSGPWIVGN